MKAIVKSVEHFNQIERQLFCAINSPRSGLNSVRQITDRWRGLIEISSESKQLEHPTESDIYLATCWTTFSRSIHQFSCDIGAATTILKKIRLIDISPIDQTIHANCCWWVFKESEIDARISRSGKWRTTSTPSTAQSLNDCVLASRMTLTMAQHSGGNT